MSKEKFFKIGKGAHVFYDPKSKLKVTENQPGKCLPSLVSQSKKCKVAIGNGHIIEIKEDEYTEILAKGGAKIEAASTDDTPEKSDFQLDLESKTKAELAEYLEDNYEVDEDETTAFQDKKHGERVEFIMGLEDQEYIK